VKLLTASVLACLLTGCAACGPPREWGEAIHPGVVFARVPVSKGTRTLRMDLYVPPKSARPAPVVIWIFGGSWKLGSRGYHVNVRDLTRAGIGVAAIDYRLSGEALWPAQIDDCRAALRWLETNGARYSLDPHRIGISGESAGGHLAAQLAALEGRDRIRAACVLYPVTDLVDIGRQYADANPSDIERLLGGPIEKELPAARSASPLNHIGPDTPPFLIYHGAKDTLVPIRHSQRLDKHLRAGGVESRLVTVPDKGHWFLLDRVQRAEVAAFFARHLGIADGY
jgi:acetyl esterase/lipase